MPVEQPPLLATPVAGIGASGGGLEAIIDFLKTMPDQPGMAIVLTQLQSLYEELSTVNTQLQAKMEELEETTSDLSSLLSSTDIAVIFLDQQLRIRRFTPAVKDLFELIPSDIGRPLHDLARKFSDDNLAADSAAVLDRLVPIEREVASESGRYYMRRALPYRTTDHRIAGVVLTFIDITTRKQTEDHLRDSETKYRLIVDGLQEHAVFLLDRDGRIATWNQESQHLLGYTAQDAIGQSMALLHTPADRNSGLADKRLQQALTHSSTEVDGWLARRDGTKFWSTGILSALREPSGELRGFVRLLRDDTDRKRQADALESAKIAAERANDAKDHFLANVSHELRTPLSSIALWTRLLEGDRDKDPAFVAEAMAAIISSTEELSGLIDDLFDTARIVAGRLKLNIEEINPASVVTAAIEKLRPSVEAKELTIELNAQPRVGPLQVDPRRLRQVLTNLLSNAIKFTPEGGRVMVDLEQEHSHVVLRVRDTGIGIEPDVLPHLFERNSQAVAGQFGATDGLGLGLSIARQLVQLHEGSISAESPGKGRGSTFTVRLPMPVIVMRKREQPAPGPVQSIEGRRILLVDDSEPNRRALTITLGGAGAEVFAVGTMAEALTTLADETFELIVSDLGLPDGDGLGLIQQARAAEKERQRSIVPAIALTAFTNSEVSNKALAAGFQSCLSKPILPEVLVNEIARLLPATKPPNPLQR